MGFFNYLMKGIGFETEKTEKVEKEKKPKKEKIQQSQKQQVQNSKFDNLFMSSQMPENNSTYSGFQYSATENGTSVAKNVIIYVPTSQNDIKNLIDFLRRKEPIIVNFSKIDDNVAPQMLSFVSGALYALKGSIHPIADELFLLTPEGVNILVPRQVPTDDDFN